MLIISATGGSGSTFIASSFKKAGWKVCLRPDVGSQKGFDFSYYKKRTAPFFKTKLKNYDDAKMFNEVYEHLHGKEKTMLLLMTWGAMNFLKGLPETRIYVIRNPIFTYNSYIKEQHLERLGGKSKDDPKIIDAFFGNYSRWNDHYRAAISDNPKYMVRYESFKEDWEKIPDVPPIYKRFEGKNNWDKIKLKKKTLDYIFCVAGQRWN